jgi:hypothetical protein
MDKATIITQHYAPSLFILICLISPHNFAELHIAPSMNPKVGG